MNCGTTRPKVTMQTAVTGDGRLAVTLSAVARSSATAWQPSSSGRTRGRPTRTR